MDVLLWAKEQASFAFGKSDGELVVAFFKELRGVERREIGIFERHHLAWRAGHFRAHEFLH